MPEISSSEKLNIAIKTVIAENKYIGQREIIRKLTKENHWSHTTINSSITKLRKEGLILYRKGPRKKYQYYMSYQHEPVYDEYLASLISKLRKAIDVIYNDNKNIAENMKEEMYFRIKHTTNDFKYLANRSKLEQNEYNGSDEEDYLNKEIMKYSDYEIPEIKTRISRAREIYGKIHTLREQYTDITRKPEPKTSPEKIDSIARDIRENTSELWNLKENIAETKHMCQEQIFRQEINKMLKPTDTLRLLKRLNMAAEKDGMVKTEMRRVCEHLEKEIKPVLKSRLAEKTVKTKKFTKADLDEFIFRYKTAGIIHCKKNKIYVLGYV